MNAWLAISMCALVTFIYVSSLYICNGDRDNPSVVKCRSFSVIAVSCFIYYTLEWLIPANHHINGISDYRNIAWAAFTTLTLFITNVYMTFLTPPDRILSTCYTDRWRLFRNLIVAPISEEIVFRKCMSDILISGGFGQVATISISSIAFWFAHLHHFWLSFRQSKNKYKMMLLIGSQCAYTAVFSIIAFVIYLKCGSIIPAIVSHGICNFFGLPKFNHWFVISLVLFSAMITR